MENSSLYTLVKNLMGYILLRSFYNTIHTGEKPNSYILLRSLLVGLVYYYGIKTLIYFNRRTSGFSFCYLQFKYFTCVGIWELGKAKLFNSKKQFITIITIIRQYFVRNISYYWFDWYSWTPLYDIILLSFQLGTNIT